MLANTPSGRELAEVCKSGRLTRSASLLYEDSGRTPAVPDYTSASSALSFPAISKALLNLPGWSRDGQRINTIKKEYIFKDFHQASAFMTGVTEFIHINNHHPNWSNVYNKVSVILTTHDAGNKVTEKDVQLAMRMEEEFKKISNGASATH